MRVITVNVPERHLDYIKREQEKGLISSRSEWVRKAVQHYIEFDMNLNEFLDNSIEDTVKVPKYEPKVIRRLE